MSRPRVFSLPTFVAYEAKRKEASERAAWSCATPCQHPSSYRTSGPRVRGYAPRFPDQRRRHAIFKALGPPLARIEWSRRFCYSGIKKMLRSADVILFRTLQTALLLLWGQKRVLRPMRCNGLQHSPRTVGGRGLCSLFERKLRLWFLFVDEI